MKYLILVLFLVSCVDESKEPPESVRLFGYYMSSEELAFMKSCTTDGKKIYECQAIRQAAQNGNYQQPGVGHALATGAAMGVGHAVVKGLLK